MEPRTLLVARGSPPESRRIFTEGTSYDRRAPKDSWGLLIPSDFCVQAPDAAVEAAVTIKEKLPRTRVWLRGMSHRCRAKPDDEERLLEIFVSQVVEPLGMVRQ